MAKRQGLRNPKAKVSLRVWRVVKRIVRRNAAVRINAQNLAASVLNPCASEEQQPLSPAEMYNLPSKPK